MVSLLVGKLPGCEAILRSTVSNWIPSTKYPHLISVELKICKGGGSLVRNKRNGKGREGGGYSLCLNP